MGGVPFVWTTCVEVLSWEAAWGRRDKSFRAFLSAVLGLPASESLGTLADTIDCQTGSEPRNLYFKMLLRVDCMWTPLLQKPRCQTV